ncbi:hypothetical protein ES705_16846 [subsurface metagenome]
MLGAKRISLEIDDELKFEFQEKLNKLNLTMREATEGLWHCFTYELSQPQALSIVNKYKIAMAKREIKLRKDRLSLYKRQEKRNAIQTEGREAIAFVVEKGWLPNTMNDEIQDVNAAFALKRRALDAGELTEKDFEVFVQKYTAYMQSKNNPAYADKESIRQAYRGLGFDDASIETYLIPEEKLWNKKKTAPLKRGRPKKR